MYVYKLVFRLILFLKIKINIFRTQNKLNDKGYESKQDVK